MSRKRTLFSGLILVAAVACHWTPGLAQAKQPASNPTVAPSNTAPGGVAMLVPPPRQVAELLPEKLQGIEAAGQVMEYGLDTLADVVGDRAAAYKEYKIVSAGRRLYGNLRVDVIQTADPFAAFGLFSYDWKEPVQPDQTSAVGFGSEGFDRGLTFWQSNFFVRVQAAAPSRVNVSLAAKLAAGVSAIISQDNAARSLPPVLDSLPRSEGAQPAVRYFLGPRSADTYVKYSAEMFSFGGDAAAAMAEYPAPALAGTSGQQASSPPLRLLIIDYNTPQFAHDALERASTFAAKLPADEQSTIILKRVGNYIVEAAGVQNRDRAQHLVDSVAYPYTVKFLENPAGMVPDLGQGRKAAAVLLSSFGILAILILLAFGGGAVFGAIVFLKRRRQQRSVFSDAGGMLTLDIEHLCTGLPEQAVLSTGGRRMLETGEE
ncbi:MAG TPA: DUF6599 family protein [Blastocatellia bacterium]|nr:DUF6599 family protein [Blastocatellia bacterium]